MAAGAGEEHLRQKTAKDQCGEHDGEDQLCQTFAHWLTMTPRVQRNLTKQQHQSRQRQRDQQRGGLRRPRAAEAEPRFHLLLPHIDVFLKVPREKTSHLGVEPIDIRDEGMQRQQRNNRQIEQKVHRERPLAASPVSVRGSRKRRRSASSRAAISP